MLLCSCQNVVCVAMRLLGCSVFLFFLAFCFAIARVTRLFLCGCLCRMSYAHSLIIEKLYQNISFKDVLVHAQEYVQYLMMACVVCGSATLNTETEREIVVMTYSVRVCVSSF